MARAVRLVACLVQLYLHARFHAARLGADGRGRAVQEWAHRLLAAVGVEVRVRGHRPPAQAPLLIVANHISWLDSYALNTVTAARFVAKAEVGEWPIIGVIARAFGSFFLKRGSCRAAARMVAVVATALADGEPVAAFPEGTTTWGDRLLHFYPAMFQAAASSGARVQPVAIRYRDARGARCVAPAYVGDMSILESLRRLLRTPRVTAELIFCAPLDPAGRTRRELAAQCRHAIAAALAFEGEPAARPTFRRAA